MSLHKLFEPNIAKMEKRKDYYRLIRALEKNKDPVLRRKSADALGRLGGKTVIEPLVQALSDSDPNVHKSASTALIKIGDESTAVSLIKTWRTDKSTLKGRTNDVLTKIGIPCVKPLYVALNDENQVIQKRASKILKAMGNIALESLINAMIDDKETEEDRIKEVEKRLGDIRWLKRGGKAREIVEKHEAWIVEFLSEIIMPHGERASELLIMKLSSGKGLFISRAKKLLVRFGQTSKEYIKKVIKQDSQLSIHTTSTLVEILDEINGEDIIETLTHLMNVNIEIYKKMKVNYILFANKWKRSYDMGYPKIQADKAKQNLELVTYFLKKLINILAKQKNHNAMEALVSALRIVDISSDAASSLDKLGLRLERTEDRVYYLIVKCDWDGLVTLGESSVIPIIELLDDLPHNQKEKAIETLGIIGDKRAVDPLIKILYKTGPHMNKKNFECAIRVLGMIGDTKAVKPLISLLWTSPSLEEYYQQEVVHTLAIDALVAIGVGAIEDSVQALSDYHKLGRRPETALLKILEVSGEKISDSKREYCLNAIKNNH